MLWGHDPWKETLNETIAEVLLECNEHLGLHWDAEIGVASNFGPQHYQTPVFFHEETLFFELPHFPEKFWFLNTYIAMGQNHNNIVFDLAHAQIREQTTLY